MLSDTTPVRSKVTLFTRHQDVFALQLLPGHLRCEEWVVGLISPPSSKGHRFILAITDCFSNWAESIPLREVKTSDVIKFIKHHVVYLFGVPRQIVYNNGPQFVSQAFQRFCNKFRIQSVSSTSYYSAANGLVEAFNKIIEKLLKKFVSKIQHE